MSYKCIINARWFMHGLAMQHTDHLGHELGLFLKISREKSAGRHTEGFTEKCRIFTNVTRVDEYVYLEMTPIRFPRCLYLALTLRRTSEISERNVWIECLNEMSSVFFGQFVPACVFRTPTCHKVLYKWSFDCQDYHENKKK